MFLAVGLLTIVLFARLRLLHIPFERDEGAFAYIGRELWNGGLLYTDLYDNKWPGLYALYAVFVRIFSAQPWGIHLGALLLHLGAGWVFVGWLRARIGNTWALLATAIWALYAASPQVAGFAAHGTQLLALPAVAGVAVLWKALERPAERDFVRVFAAGLLFGLAICIKQQAFFYPVFGVTALLIRRRRAGLLTAGALLAGSAVPLALLAGWFAVQGRFQDFFFWTIQLPIQLADGQNVDSGAWFLQFSGMVMQYWWPVWALALAGVYHKRILLLLPALGLGAISVGGLFFPHYFVLILPWLALLAMYGGILLTARLGRIGWGLLTLALVMPVALQPGYWFYHDYRRVLRDVYIYNPFPEMVEIGRQLRQRTQPGETIAVIGSEPELLVYAGRKSTTRALFLYGAVQSHSRQAQFQQEYLDEFHKNRPRFVVFPSALVESVQTTPLVQTLFAEIKQSYQPVATVEIYPDRSLYNWNVNSAGTMPRSPAWIIILERL